LFIIIIIYQEEFFQSSLQNFTVHLKRILVADMIGMNRILRLKMCGEILYPACTELLMVMNNYLFETQKKSKDKGKVVPITGLRPRGFQEVKVPGFRDNGPGWW
jgi:hypothetical protein